MQKQISQRQKMASELLKVSVNVTEHDRKAYVEKFGVTLAMVSAYLTGKAASVELAIPMLTFFLERISERQKVIDELSKNEFLKV